MVLSFNFLGGFGSGILGTTFVGRKKNKSQVEMIGK